MISKLNTLILAPLLVVLGCGQHSPPQHPSEPIPATRVVTVTQQCLSVPPPSPPPLLVTEMAGDEPLTADALDLLEQFTAALVGYSSRAWRDCGGR